jgi:hypothetical protein
MVAVSTAAPLSEAAPVDARPVRVTSTETLWDRALVSRDQCAAEMRKVLAAEGIGSLVVLSQHGNYPPWAKLEAWIPAGPADASVRERVELDVIVDIKPCHKSEIVHTARLKKGKTKISANERPVFSREDVSEWTAFAVGRGPKPSSYSPMRDALLALLGGIIPPLRPHRNPIVKPYRSTGLTLRRVLIGGGVLLYILASAVAPVAPAVVGVAVLPWLAALAAAPFIVRRRRHIDAVTSQPLIAPRNLGLVDSWQAVVTGLGPDCAHVRQRLHQQMAAARHMGIKCQWETYGYRTPNGYEERERLVMVKGQSVVQAHIYPFGPDLFVGWHAFLNWAKWDEQKIPTSRIERGREIKFHSLRPGVYIPSLFDLIDLNALSDLVHRHFERELKARLKERAIDQEIDFEIIRGDRDLALEKSRHVKDDGATSRWSKIMSAASLWQPASLTEQQQSAAPEKSAGAEGSAGVGARKKSWLGIAWLLFTIAILAAIAIPQYSEYVERAKYLQEQERILQEQDRLQQNWPENQ